MKNFSPGIMGRLCCCGEVDNFCLARRFWEGCIWAVCLEVHKRLRYHGVFSKLCKRIEKMFNELCFQCSNALYLRHLRYLCKQMQNVYEQSLAYCTFYIHHPGETLKLWQIIGPRDFRTSCAPFEFIHGLHLG